MWIHIPEDIRLQKSTLRESQVKIFWSTLCDTARSRLRAVQHRRSRHILANISDNMYLQGKGVHLKIIFLQDCCFNSVYKGSSFGELISTMAN
jgi:hypothetical protein